MLTFIPHIQSFVHETQGNAYDFFIVDLWGVLHDGHQAYPGVVETLRQLQAAGKQVVLLSNSPRRVSQIEENLRNLGILRDLYKALYTSGEHTFHQLSKAPRGKKVFALRHDYHATLIKDLGLEEVQTVAEADFILNTGPVMTHASDYDAVLQEAQCLGKPMICANPDLKAPSGDLEVLCAGTVAQRYEDMDGLVDFYGKPHKCIYEAVFEIMGNPNPARVLAIGDGLATDIKGAENAGIHSALVMTGLQARHPVRAWGAEAFRASLQEDCERLGLAPTYLIPGFVWE